MAIEAGVNVSSVQDDLCKDYFRTLERLAELGYKNVELIGYNKSKYTRFMDDIPIDQLKEKLTQYDLTVISAQELGRSDRPIDVHDWDAVCSYYEQINCHSIVIPTVWMQNRDDAVRIAGEMNRVGQRLKANGFAFYYHNHAHEFQRDGEETLYDILIQNTDPDYVRFELDLGWVLRAGIQPTEILEKLGSRCEIVHLKDININPRFPVNIFEALKQDGMKAFDSFKIYQSYTSPEDYADLGSGAYDLASLFTFIKEMGHTRYAIVENIGASSDKFNSLASDLDIVRQYI
ncbi:sugar phosphate isomerase/epimerase family protein [Paenibacillus silviterrae]|uniref:sugar phosphate isomerase/epimerase family protein n=1 Tax=Paenibacillus silviterrae TaxID=3242194 RepID=UPI002543F6FC|nr:sugar phosphate isomerase/epimerase [Paenibacillus chinjuensis]